MPDDPEPHAMTLDERAAGMSRREYIFQDWHKNQAKAKFVLAWFRLAQVAPRGTRTVIRNGYRFVVDALMGIELEWPTKVGPELELWHGHGLVVHPKSVIGARVMLRHGVTIGQKQAGGPWPVIGDDVEFGAGAVVIGGINVGAGAKIGANAVVTKDVPAGRIAVGNPARLLEPKSSAAPQP